MQYNFYFKSRDVIFEHIKLRLFRGLTKRSSRLFLRGGDTISIAPQITGEHEPVLSGFLTQCAQAGYGDFLIDIGANIGLVACQIGAHFDMIHMFEPNPLCAQILSVNAALSLHSGHFQVHSVGIGTQQGQQILTVPRNNWGGAFLRTDENAYSDALLAQKDGFSSLDSENYFEVTVKIVDGIAIFTEIFKELAADNKTAGVIKIDVEGFEIPILKAIARTLPDNAKVIIAFENWDMDFAPQTLLSAFSGRARLHVFDRERPWPIGASHLRKILGLMFGRRLCERLVPWEQASSLMGDLVLYVAPDTRCSYGKNVMDEVIQ